MHVPFASAICYLARLSVVERCSVCVITIYSPAYRERGMNRIERKEWLHYASSAWYSAWKIVLVLSFGTYALAQVSNCAKTYQDVVGDASLLKAAGKGHTVKVAVEGNIGSGKTTFLEGCQQFVDTTVLIEPVTIWRDLQGQNLLELMYKEPKRWSLAFQTYVQLTMMQLHLAPVQTPVKLMERSLHSARYVFIENLYCRCAFVLLIRSLLS
ncbi:deoxyguanosine kinase, mitochondrial isoform X4 [Dermacentor andersoni]|uniref:deoxyguanosine kinase, mitochondrial isoform X4 n=1 Tax=Dermacentor andersoni TaxID=34620 RepID=UPI003B3A2945